MALRAIIRAKRKANEDWLPELNQLYRLAAVDSFRLDYSERLGQPGYNVMEIIPGEKVISLPFDYRELGTEKLHLLTKTDVRWLEEHYGQPSAHTTLNALHHDLWRRHEDRLIAEKDARDREFAVWLEDPGSELDGTSYLTADQRDRVAARDRAPWWLDKRVGLLLAGLAGIILYAAT